MSLVAKGASTLCGRWLQSKGYELISCTKFSTKSMPDFNFDDHAVAFKHKTTLELLRTAVILKMCSFDVLVDNSLKLMNIGQRSLVKPLFNAIMHKTFYPHFVAGEGPDEVEKMVETMKRSNIQPLPTAMLEENEIIGEDRDTRYLKNLDIVKKCIMLGDRIGTGNLKMAHFKFTGFMSCEILIRMSEIYTQSDDKTNLVKLISDGMLNEEIVRIGNLTKTENAELNEVIKRLTVIGKMMEERQVKVLIDAEYVNTNPGIELFSMAMMIAFNRKSVLLYMTYQCYLKKTYEKVKEQLDIVRQLNGRFAAKVVRGAYINIEKEMARTNGYEDPVCDSFEKTSEQYNRVIKLFLTNIAEEPQHFGVVIASHNEDSIIKAAKLIEELKISKSNTNAVMAQIFGLGDNISCTLANKGYTVFKSIPYGPLEELLPYLSRRAIENKALVHGSHKERKMVGEELKRRVLLR